MLFLDNATDRQVLNLLTKSMSNEDIEKSLSKSGLVQVERIVVKPGVKPFQQKFWVKPDQVKKTDIVLSNRVNKHSVSEKSIEETKQFYEDCGDDETFYLMLQDQNVRWVESDDPTENLSRAKRAFAEYLDALNVHDQKVKEQQLQKLKNANPRDTGINFDIQDLQAQEYLKILYGRYKSKWK